MSMLPPTPSSRVNVPGIGLIATGALGGVAALADEEAAEALGGIGVLMGLSVIGLLISAFVAYAGLQMRQLRSWGVVVAGAILSMVPRGPCCIVGLPFGIWAILVLIDEEVKRAFGDGPIDDVPPSPPAPPPAGPPSL